jgi:hypothetical protein
MTGLNQMRKQPVNLNWWKISLVDRQAAHIPIRACGNYWNREYSVSTRAYAVEHRLR